MLNIIIQYRSISIYIKLVICIGIDYPKIITLEPNKSPMSEYNVRYKSEWLYGYICLLYITSKYVYVMHNLPTLTAMSLPELI